MALDLAINSELRRIPDPESDDIATVRHALELYDEAVLASSSVDGDMGLPVDTSRVHGATLVRVAEAAVDYGEDEDALRAIDAFFREDPPRNQFFIRALFVKGILRGREAVTLNGFARLVAVREAVAFVLQGLSICEENADPAYNFLIYNASVHHWAVVRPLLREGSKREAIASFVRITDTLAKVDDPDVRWRARNLMALSTCHAEAGDLDKAVTIATQAQDILLQRLGAAAAGAPGTSDYALIEEAYRLRIHFATLSEPDKAFDGGGKASAAASAAFSALSTAAAAGSTVKPPPDTRAQVLTQLQAILTASAPAQGATGYSHSIGRGKSSLLQQASGVEGSAVVVTQSPMNPDGLRSKLLDMLKLIRPAAHAEYAWRKAESDLGTIKMYTPDFARDQKEKELAAAAKSAPAPSPAPAKGAPAVTPTAGSSSSSSALFKDQLKKEILKKGKDLDVIALIAHAAAHCGLFDVAYSAIKTVHADKTSSPASQILSDIVDAQLLVYTTSIQDAHQLLGHFVEIPVDIINTLAIVEQGEQDSKGKDGMPKTRTRRQSLAQAMSVGFVPKRNSLGDALMLPGGHVYGSAESPIPSLTPEIMLKLSHYRREAAMKPLRRCLATCRSLGDAFLAELASTVTWNIALPLLTAQSRAIAFPALQEAAETLHHLDSPLVRLRVRLHLECARAAYKADLLASSADHVEKALALDYGGLRFDHHYSVSAERNALHGSIGASGDDLRKKRERAGSASLRKLLFKAPEDPRELSSQRPLDRQLIQLGRESIVAATVYDDPNDPLDQAFVSLQQANAASEPALTATLLAKAAAQLDSAQNTPREAAAAWRRMRSPSFAIATSETSAVISPVAEDASDAAQRASTAAAPMPSSKPGTAAASKPGTASASKPGTAKSGGAESSAHESHGEFLPVVHAATPAAAAAALAAGSTLALSNAMSAELLSGGSARRKQAHRMWMKIAESAAKVKQWDLVLRATHEIRSYSWDPVESREMVLLQVRADLLTVDASAAKARSFSEVGMDEKVNHAALRAVRLAVKRVSAAVGRFHDSSSSAVSFDASAKKGAVSASSNKEMEEKKDIGETQDLYWWEQGDFFHRGQYLMEEIQTKIMHGPIGGPDRHRSHRSSLKAPADVIATESTPDDDELLEKIEIPSVDSHGYFMSPQDRYSGPENNFEAVLEGPSMVVDPAWEKKHAGIPKIFVSSEVGYAPGFKPILNDARTLGLIIPGCPITLSAWKLRLISALGRSMRRGVSVKAAWVVETAAARLWNFHLHVWRQNIYGPAVFPQLLDVMRDSLECLKFVGASNYRLVAKIAHAYARSQEEAMRAALVDRQLQESHSFPKHETRINAYEGICGAVLYDFRKIPKKAAASNVAVSGVQSAIAARDAVGSKPGTALSNSTIGSKELAHPVEPIRASLELAKAPLNDGDPEIIKHVLTQTLPESPAVCKAKAESAISLALSLPTSALPVTARRDLFAIRARMKIYEMSGHGISEFLVPLSLSDAAKAAAAAASPVSASSTSDLVTAVSKCVTSSDPSYSTHDGGCPEFAKAVCLLQIPMHCNVPFNEKVIALREAISATEKASAELHAIVEGARAQVLAVGGLGSRSPQPVPAAAPVAGKQAPAAGKAASTAGSVQTQVPGGSNEWGEGDPTVTSVHSMTSSQQAGFNAAMGMTATAAVLDARAEELSRDVTAALSELWAMCASTAVELAKHSQRVLIDAKLAQDAYDASIPKTADKKSGIAAGKGKENTAVSAAAGAAIALTPLKLNEPDLSLLVDAQRCAASSIRLSPAHSLRIDELGSLFGLRGHDYSEYKLSLGAEHVKTVKRNAEIVDVHIGRVNFTHRFYSGPDGTSVDGATVGGKTNCIKWWAVAELAWGSAVLLLVNSDRQSAIEQDHLRRIALDHLGQSAEWAVKVRDSSLVSTAAFLIWNICIQVNNSAATRTSVIPSATRILSAMREIAKAPGHGLTHDACILRAELYRLLLQSLSDVKQWAEGLSLAEEAFSNLPTMYHDRLWIHRLIFNSKLGQDVTHLLTSVSTKSPLLQSRLWCTLARLAALPADQGAAYVAALEKLQGMFARTFVLIDYAEWLHSARLPVEDARDALHTAADNIITVFDHSMTVNDEEVDAKSSVYGSTAHVGSVEGRGSDLGSIQRSHVTRGASTFKARSSIAASEALPSMANSSAVQNTAKVGAGSTVSAFRVATEPQDWPERGDASHIDALIRIFSLLALMAGSFGERAKFLLLAAHYTRSLWEMSARSANSAAAERALFKMRSSERNQIPDLTKWVEDAVENGKHQIPHEWSEWAEWWPKVCLHLAAAEEAQHTGSDLRSSHSADENAVEASDNNQVPPTASMHASAAQSKAASVAASKLPSAAGSQTASRAASRPGSRPSSAGKKDKTASSEVSKTVSAHGHSDELELTEDQVAKLAEDEAKTAAITFVELREAMRRYPLPHQMFGATKFSIKKPAMTLHTLFWLVDQLVDSGYVTHAAPVLAMIYTISTDILDPATSRGTFSASVLARCSVWLDSVNQRFPAGALFSRLAAGRPDPYSANQSTQSPHGLGALSLTDADRSALEGDVLLMELDSRNRERGLSGVNSKEIAKGNLTVGTGLVSALAEKKFLAALRGSSHGPAGLVTLHRRVIDKAEVHLAWAELANFAVSVGMTRGARQLLLETIRHSTSFNDWVTLSNVRIAQARISEVEGDGKEAVDILLSAIQGQTDTDMVGHSDAKTWFSVVSLLSKILVENRLYTDARKVLEASLHAFDGAAHPGTIDIPDLSLAQLDRLGSTDRFKDDAGKAADGKRAETFKRTKKRSDVVTMPPSADRPTAISSTDPDLDALSAAIRTRLLLAEVYTIEATRGRKVGSSWVSDWKTADKLFADAASLCRREGGNPLEDGAGGLLPRALLAHAQAILALPGADPDLFPVISNDAAFSSVAEGSVELEAKFRAASLPRRARLLYIALACKLLHDANATCTKWEAATGVRGVPPTWSTPASRLSNRIRTALVNADLLCAEEELAAALSSERFLYSSVSSDPISLYIFQAEREAASSGAVQLSQATPQRALLAADAALSAISNTHPGLRTAYSRAVVAYGCALRGVLIASAASLQFTSAPKGSSESLLTLCGTVELQKYIWKMFKPTAPKKSDIAEPEPVDEVHTGEEEASSRPGTVASTKGGKATAKDAPKGDAKGGSKPSNKGGKPGTAPTSEDKSRKEHDAHNEEGYRSEFMPLPFEDTSSVATTKRALGHVEDEEECAASFIPGQVLPDVGLESVVIPQNVKDLYRQALKQLQLGVITAAVAGEWPAVAAASANLVELYGTLSPVRATASLALLQSINASKDLKAVFVRASGLASRQVLHMRILEQTADFSAVDGLYGSGTPLSRSARLHPSASSAVYGPAKSYLKSSSLAYRMMQPATRGLDEVLALLPHSTRVLIVEPSPSGRTIYAAVAVRLPNGYLVKVASAQKPAALSVSRPVTAQAKKAHEDATAAFEKAEAEKMISAVDALGISANIDKMDLSDSQLSELADLIRAASTIRTDMSLNVRQFTQDIGAKADISPEAIHEVEAREQERKIAHDSGIDNSSDAVFTAAGASSVDLCEANVSKLITSFRTFFDPLLGLQSSLAPWLVGQTGVIMCISKSLTHLPFESLLTIADARSVTRDFSVSVLGHRLAASALMADPHIPPTKPPHSIDIHNWFSHAPPETCHASNASIRFVVDPRHEDPKDKMISVIVSNAGGEDTPAAPPVSQLKRRTLLDSVDVLLKGQKSSSHHEAEHHIEDSTKKPLPAAKGSKPGTASSVTKPIAVEADPTVHEPKVPAQSAILLDLLDRPTELSQKSEDGVDVIDGLCHSWSGLRGDSSIPSPAAWQALIRSSPVKPDGSGGGMVYVGHGRLFAYLPPEAVAGLMAPGCRFAFLADSVSNNKQANQQALLDNAKKQDDGRLELEETWETAALLTLTGVGVVIAQQWPQSYSTLEALLLETVSQAVLRKVPLAQAVRRVWRRPEPGAEAAALAAKETVKEARIAHDSAVQALRDALAAKEAAPPIQEGEQTEVTLAYDHAVSTEAETAANLERALRIADMPIPEESLPVKSRVRYATLVYGIPQLKIVS